MRKKTTKAVVKTVTVTKSPDFVYMANLQASPVPVLFTDKGIFLSSMEVSYCKFKGEVTVNYDTGIINHSSIIAPLGTVGKVYLLNKVDHL